MKKIITVDQINAILQVTYPTNISAQTYDALKNLFIGLPEYTEPKTEEATPVKSE